MQWIILIMIVVIFSRFGVLVAQTDVDKFSNIDNSFSSTFDQKWDITRKAPYLI